MSRDEEINLLLGLNAQVLRGESVDMNYGEAFGKL